MIIWVPFPAPSQTSLHGLAPLITVSFLCLVLLCLFTINFTPPLQLLFVHTCLICIGPFLYVPFIFVPFLKEHT